MRLSGGGRRFGRLRGRGTGRFRLRPRRGNEFGTFSRWFGIVGGGKGLHDTYDLGVNRYATLKSESTRAVFGESFTLEIPEYEGSAAFYGWYLADETGDATDERVEDGVYTYTRDILVVARWQEWSDVVS